MDLNLFLDGILSFSKDYLDSCTQLHFSPGDFSLYKMFIPKVMEHDVWYHTANTMCKQYQGTIFSDSMEEIMESFRGLGNKGMENLRNSENVQNIPEQNRLETAWFEN